ncbi:MAG: S41 family peptidase [Schleiferiaceae bacterium]|nr:S41 family peptidase [Schleiferiaceae bacterium]
MKIRLQISKMKRTLFLALAGGLVVLFSAFELNYFEVSKHLDIFANVYREVNLYYVDDVEPGTLMESAIEGMLESLDPYTNYYPENKIEDLRLQTTGQYGGIGASIRKIKDYIVIVQPYKGFPADNAGLKPGDILLKVDEKDLKNLNTEEVSSLLKGAPGTSFTLTIKRGETNLKKKITREEVQIKSVPYFGVIDDGIGYITLTSFTDKASKEIIEALDSLKASHDLKGIVLDLRGNPGGLLPEAINVTNIFIDRGKEVVSTRGKAKEMDKKYFTLNDAKDTEIPVAVLINRTSASASEIVSGSMQDYDRGVVIGQRSFGKGLVQQTRKLTYNSQMKVTIAKYYTASGRCIQAINYGERDENGSIKRVPDSLRTPFQTVNGRTVYDGAGVDPDVALEPKELPNILISLVQSALIFDFANRYAEQHPNPPAIGAFELSNADYQSFVAFLDGKEYSYDTRTEKIIKELQQTATAEKYTELEADINHMKALLKASKADDLQRHRADIQKFLEEEIAARYHYQEGRIAQSLGKDPEVLEAISILKDPVRYKSILSVEK